MSLPYFIEYILTLQAPGSGRLAHMAYSQWIGFACPPNFDAIYEGYPSPYNYALIWFRTEFSPTMVPFAWWVSGQQYGATIQSGVVSALTIRHPFDWYIVVTDAEPYRGHIVNLTPLVQYFEMLHSLLTISSEEYLKLLIEHLQKLTTSNVETLATEANKLLAAIARVYPARRT